MLPPTVVTVAGADRLGAGARDRRRPGRGVGRARGRQRPRGSTRSTTGSSRARSRAAGSVRRRSRCRPTCRWATTSSGPAAATPRPAPTWSSRPAWLGLPERADRQRQWGFATQLYSVRSGGSWGLGDLDRPHRPGRLVGQRAGRRLRPGQPAARRRAAGAAGAVAVPAQLAPVLQPDLPARRADPRVRRAAPARAGRGRPARRPAAALADAAGPGRPRRELDREARRPADRPRRAAERRARARLRGLPARARARRSTDFATWNVLAEDHGNDAREWPADYRRHDSPAVRRSRDEHADRVDFECWLQWVLDEQLQQAQAKAENAGMSLGVMHDLAVGVHPGGADAWRLQDVYAQGVQVGAPPDPYNQLGQDWSQPPWRPDRLAELGYQPFRDLIGAVLRHAGGVRVDHIIGMFRLWWIPVGGPAHEGTYVRYDHAALIGVLALEAHRAGRRRRRRGPRRRRPRGPRLPARARHPRHLDPLVRARRRRRPAARPSTGASGAWPRSPPTTCRPRPATSPATRSGCSTSSGCSRATSTTSSPRRGRRSTRWLAEVRRRGLLARRRRRRRRRGAAPLPGAHPGAAALRRAHRRGRRPAHPEPARHHRRVPQLAGPAGRPGRRTDAARGGLHLPSGRARSRGPCRGRP